MEKQEEERTSLPVKKNTCFAGWEDPPTWVGSADGGEVHPADAGVADGSRSLGSTPRNPPMLPERLQRRFDDRRKK